MTSNPTVEAYGRLWAQHIASEKQKDRRRSLDTDKPLMSTFTFAGPTPSIKKPRVVFFPSFSTANMASPVTTKLDLDPPRAPAPRPWDYCLFGSALPRFHGRNIYKRAGILAQSPSSDSSYVTAERELARIQSGPRKRMRFMSFFQHYFDSEATLLWDFSSPDSAVTDRSDGIKLLEDARNVVFQHYIDLHQQSLPVPKLIEHHTWHGSIEIETMTIIPRKRRYNSEPILRYEEAQFERQMATSTDARKKLASTKSGRHIITCRRAPRLSTVDECTEPSESPRRDVETLLATSPSKSLICRLSTAGHRVTLSPWRFTYMTPLKAVFEDHGTPSKLSVTHDNGSPVSPRPLSPMRAAAMLRTPDCFLSSPMVASRLQHQSSPVVFDKPVFIIDHTTPTNPVSHDTGRTSTPTKKHRGRRRSSLAANRLLAISEHANSHVSSPSWKAGEAVPVATPAAVMSAVDTTVTQNFMSTEKELSLDVEAKLASSGTPENVSDTFASTNFDAETPAPIFTPTEILGIPQETGHRDDEMTGTLEQPHPQSGHVDSDTVIQPVIAQVDLMPTSLSTCQSAFVMSAPAGGSLDMVDVDLRKNLDIFGCGREGSAQAHALSSPIIPLSRTINDVLYQSPKSDHHQEVENEILDEEDDDDITNVINHEQINDTIALKLPDMVVDSSQVADEKASEEKLRSILSPNRDQEESEDENREHLQSFLKRIKADKSAKAIKLKRRSGSIGISVTGSPLPRVEPGSGDESGSKRQPLGEKSPNMSPSPTKKRKTVEDEISSGFLQTPSLEDHSPPRPKRRRKNTELESDGVLNPEFLAGGVQPPRRSTRTKRNLLPPAPSANVIAMSKLPVIRSTAVDDGGFGGSPSSATVRNDDRQLQATTRANTRRNKAGAMHASDVLNLQAKRKLSSTDGDEEEENPRVCNKRAKATKSDSAKSVRWGMPLASYQEPPCTGVSASSSESADELAADNEGAVPASALAPVVAAAAPTNAPVTRRRTASRLPPPTPIKKPNGVAASKAKKPSTMAAPRRTSAQLAAASAAKEEAVRKSVAVAVEAKEQGKKPSARSKIGVPATASNTTTRRRAARAA